MYLSKNKVPTIEMIFVGLPKTLGNDQAKNPLDQEWTSSIFKEPVCKPVFASKTNLSGDQQADLKHHGGPEKAIFTYPSEHYIYWQKTLNQSNILPGGMGENFSTINLLESHVAIGDIFQVGKAIIQVSQPRQPCWKPARRYRTKELAILLQNSGRTGWYYRVLEEGWIEAGQSVQLIDRVTPEWTIAQCNDVMHRDRENFKRVADLAATETLASNWKATLQKRLENRKAEDIERRVYGPNKKY